MNTLNIERELIERLPINEKNKKILQRRLNKFKRDPKLFIEDSCNKRKNQTKKYLPIKYKDNYQYTLVSAIYDLEKYFDKYFESLINKSLSFTKHIYLILVNDESMNNSANIIKKYPIIIHIINRMGVCRKF